MVCVLTPSYLGVLLDYMVCVLTPSHLGILLGLHGVCTYTVPSGYLVRIA